MPKECLKNVCAIAIHHLQLNSLGRNMHSVICNSLRWLKRGTFQKSKNHEESLRNWCALRRARSIGGLRRCHAKAKCRRGLLRSLQRHTFQNRILSATAQWSLSHELHICTANLHWSLRANVPTCLAICSHWTATLQANHWREWSCIACRMWILWISEPCKSPARRNLILGFSLMFANAALRESSY